MNDQAIRFRFGIFVLASLILLAVLVVLFGGFPNYFRRSEAFTIIFGNAQGVAPGTPVKRSGVRIGEVRTVEFDNDTGKVKVEIRIDDKYYLRKNDRAVLQQGLLGGDATIAFIPPDDPKLDLPIRLEPGTVLAGQTPADAGTLMQQTSDLVKPVQEAVVEMRKVFQGINKMTPVVDETLKDFREIGKMARKITPDVQQTSEEIRLLSKTTREAIPEIQATARTWGKVGERVDVLLKVNEDKITKSIDRADETLKRINDMFGDENQKLVRDTLKNVKNGTQQLEQLSKDTSDLLKDSRATVKQLNDTLKRADDTLLELQKAMKPFNEKGAGTFKNLDQSADNLNKTLKDLRELIQVVARGDGTVQRLLSDPSLYNNVNDSAIMVTKILPRIDRVLRDMEIFSDKLARHPELLGLRGVIVPSVGLKESPYRIYP